MTELENLIKSSVVVAMLETQHDSLEIMQKETGEFYTQGKPKRYIRTGALGNTPRITPLKISPGAKAIEFEAYLDQSHNYTTGTFSMTQVLQHAEDSKNRAGILGKPGFWQESKKQIEKDLNKNMKKHFKKG